MLIACVLRVGANAPPEVVGHLRKLNRRANPPVSTPGLPRVPVRNELAADWMAFELADAELILELLDAIGAVVDVGGSIAQFEPEDLHDAVDSTAWIFRDPGG